MDSADSLAYRAEIRVPARGADQFGTIVAVTLTDADTEPRLACFLATPDPGRHLCDLTPEEIFAQARSQERLRLKEAGTAITLPRTSVNRIAKWLRELGFSANVRPGVRSRPSSLAERREVRSSSPACASF